MLQEFRGVDVPSLSLWQNTMSPPHSTPFSGRQPGSQHSFSAHITQYWFVDGLTVVTVRLRFSSWWVPSFHFLPIMEVQAECLCLGLDLCFQSSNLKHEVVQLRRCCSTQMNRPAALLEHIWSHSSTCWNKGKLHCTKGLKKDEKTLCTHLNQLKLFSRILHLPSELTI